MSSVLPSHRFLDHTGEVEFVITAPSLGELYAEAGQALAALLLGAPADRAPRTAGPRFTIELSAPDPAALLVDWLNELIYHREREGAVFVAFDVQPSDGTSLRAEIRGIADAPTVLEVKAATLHEARIEAVDGGYQGHVVLDV